MYSHFVSCLGFCSTEEDQISNGATTHVAYPILSIPCLLMPWWLKEPGHQQSWYWSPKPEYPVSRIWGATGELPAQRPVTRSFDISFDRRLHKWLSKQSRGWWLEMPSHALWCHCNAIIIYEKCWNGVHPLRAHSGGICDSSINVLTDISRPILWWQCVDSSIV